VSRRPRTFAVLLAVVAALAVTAGSVSPAVAKPVPKVNTKTQAKKLAKQFFTLLKGKSTPALKRYLSPAFLLQRADGSTANRTEYLKSVTNVKSFTLDRFKVTKSGDTISATYWATTDQIVDGKEYLKDPAPRLSVWQWDGKGWHLLAHANFNAPVVTR
jgi:hypothetical protein